MPRNLSGEGTTLTDLVNKGPFTWATTTRRRQWVPLLLHHPVAAKSWHCCPFSCPQAESILCFLASRPRAGVIWLQELGPWLASSQGGRMAKQGPCTIRFLSGIRVLPTSGVQGGVFPRHRKEVQVLGSQNPDWYLLWSFPSLFSLVCHDERGEGKPSGLAAVHWKYPKRLLKWSNEKRKF